MVRRLFSVPGSVSGLVSFVVSFALATCSGEASSASQSRPPTCLATPRRMVSMRAGSGWLPQRWTIPSAPWPWGPARSLVERLAECAMHMVCGARARTAALARAETGQADGQRPHPDGFTYAANQASTPYPLRPIGRSTPGTDCYSRTALYSCPPADRQADPLRKPACEQRVAGSRPTGR